MDWAWYKRFYYLFIILKGHSQLTYNLITAQLPSNLVTDGSWVQQIIQVTFRLADKTKFQRVWGYGPKVKIWNNEWFSFSVAISLLILIQSVYQYTDIRTPDSRLLFFVAHRFSLCQSQTCMRCLWLIFLWGTY